ncbi:hypothetical protein EV715DRAFT_298272 [Schizophyllum commune]
MPNRFRAPSTVSSATSTTTVLRLPGAYPLSQQSSLLSIGTDVTDHAPLGDADNAHRRLIVNLRAQLEESSRRFHIELQLANKRTSDVQRQFEEYVLTHQYELRDLAAQLQDAKDALEEERVARLELVALLEQLQPREPVNVFDKYATLWDKMTTTRQSIFTIESFPWPVVRFDGLESMTYEAVREFVLHPARLEATNKTCRSVIKAEIVRFHSDKFATFALRTFVPEHRQSILLLD